MRAFTKVDEEGRIFIPDNIRRAAAMPPGQLVEIKIAGGSKIRESNRLIIHHRKSRR